MSMYCDVRKADITTKVTSDVEKGVTVVRQENLTNTDPTESVQRVRQKHLTTAIHTDSEDTVNSQ